MSPHADAAAYLLHTLTLLGYHVPTVSEGIRRGLLNEGDWQRALALFERWQGAQSVRRAA